MRAFSSAWPLPVTWWRWWLHHSICHIRKPMLHANFTAVCVTEAELLPLEVLHCQNRDCRPLLLLWPWPWPDDLHTKRPAFRGDVLDVRKWTSYVKAFESYRLTDMHTYRQIDRQTQTPSKLYTTPFRGCSKKCNISNWMKYNAITQKSRVDNK